MTLDDVTIFIIPLLIDNVHFILIYVDVALRIIRIIDSLTYKQLCLKAEQFKLVCMYVMLCSFYSIFTL